MHETEVLEKYNESKNYYFDDLGVEPTESHYAKEYNIVLEFDSLVAIYLVIQNQGKE